ncbi:tail fiber assembly protein [Citrobacter sp. BDA59-3]|uniref:tail fiber assembly protein n=1 Tax=Citrobacter sp. BDA59-3 TaxID=2781952 RepID=UPI0018818C6A|nr:tail fiber assembly protein [Citrobacter sp. BDA59-3]QOV70438.1 tail fiber assembly protein [Citrobacter sp. BDA59-3]
MAYFYSAKTNGFYPDDLKSDYEKSETGWPTDAIEVSDDLYNEMFAGQTAGKVISPGTDGLPILTEPVIDYELKKQSLLQGVTTKTQAWQTQLMLGIITDSDKTLLRTWMEYYQQVQAVDISKAPDITWPEQPAA